MSIKRLYKLQNTKLFIIGILLIYNIGVLSVYYFNNAESTESRNNIIVNASQPTPNQELELPIIFRDSVNGTVFSLQTILGQSGLAKFSFYVPQVGYYSGTIPILQSGIQIIHPQGSVTSLFSKLNGGVPVSVNVRMEGEINKHHNTASLNIWVDNKKYDLKTMEGNTNDAVKVAKQVSELTVSRNWFALYGLLSSDVQAIMTQAQFIQSMTDSKLSTIVNVDLNGSGQIKIDTGYTYFIQPIALVIRQEDGSNATFKANEYFVLEQGTWRFLSTDTPIPQ